MVETVKPTVYLIKNTVENPDDVLKETPGLQKIEIEAGSLYYIPSQIHPPKWLSFLAAQFELDRKLFMNASAYAVIVLQVSGRFFAIPFGMGSHLINMGKIDYNFGLKVAINSIPKGDLRQMDLTTPEATSQKTKKQAVKESTPEEFGINKQKDILRGVVGKLPKDHALGKRIEGKDSIKATRKIEDLFDLKEFCKILLETSASDKYKEDYPWIDNMAVVSDPIMVEALYTDLIAAIKTGEFDNMYITTPQFIDNLYEFDGYVFTGDRKRTKNKTAYEFPTMTDLVDELGEEFIAELDREALSKSCKVCLRDSEGELAWGWPLARCVVWEAEKDGHRYILSEGYWYKIDTQFYGRVCGFFDRHVHDAGLPGPAGSKIKEADYNAGVCAAGKELYLFDLGHQDAKGKHITSNRNEICDIFDAENKRFIHVKVGKSSADISHLLRQGVFSGTALKMDADALQTFRNHLREDGCPDDVIRIPYVPSDYEIGFAVILDENQKKDIPFFSKASFQDTAELTLEMMGYRCRFSFIIRGGETAKEEREINAELGGQDIEVPSYKIENV